MKAPLALTAMQHKGPLHKPVSSPSDLNLAFIILLKDWCFLTLISIVPHTAAEIQHTIQKGHLLLTIYNENYCKIWEDEHDTYEIYFSEPANWNYVFSSCLLKKNRWHQKVYFFLSLDICGLDCIFLFVLLYATAATNKKQITTTAEIAQN